MTRAEKYYRNSDAPYFAEAFYNYRIRHAIIRAYEAGYRQARKTLKEVDDD